MQSIQTSVNCSHVYVIKAAEMLSNSAMAGIAPEHKELLGLLRDSMSLAGYAVDVRKRIFNILRSK